MIRRLLAVAFVAVLPVIAVATDFPLTGSNTEVKFVGSKPQGKHDGGFKAVTGKAGVAGTDATTLQISLDIDMNSLYSDTAKLTDHLKSPDFFGVKSNPKSKFATKVEKDAPTTRSPATSRCSARRKRSRSLPRFRLPTVRSR